MLSSIVEVTCAMCGESHCVAVNESDFYAWKGGKLIQDAMPYLSVGERELLISHTCDSCFDTLFGDDD